MAIPKIPIDKLRNRIRRLSLTELLLIALLLCFWSSLNKQAEIEQSLHTIDDSLVDVQNKVGDESSDIQDKLDDIKDALDQIAANQ